MEAEILKSGTLGVIIIALARVCFVLYTKNNSLQEEIKSVQTAWRLDVAHLVKNYETGMSKVAKSTEQQNRRLELP